MARTSDVHRLLEALSVTTKESLTLSGFNRMSDESNNITGRYLYDLYRKVKNNLIKGNDETNFRLYMLDGIAKRLGFNSFKQFCENDGQPMHPILKRCLGVWYSLVKANQGNFIFKAPLEIYIDENNKVAIRLKGGEREFKGNLTLKGSVLYCHLESGTDKTLYLVLKLGDVIYPKVIQGVFAGMSSSGDPIAGIEVLIREDRMDYKDMKWEKLKIDSPKLDDIVRQYFITHQHSYIRINKASSFNMDDLMQ